MALIGGSKSRTTQNTTITEANIQNNLAAGEYGGAPVAITLANSQGNSLQLTDHRAVEDALGFAGRALDSGLNSFQNSLEAFGENFKLSQQKQSATVDAALQLARESTQSDANKGQDTIKWIVGLLVVGVIAWSIKK